jgi:hypothetical protein
MFIKLQFLDAWLNMDNIITVKGTAERCTGFLAHAVPADAGLLNTVVLKGDDALAIFRFVQANAHGPDG